MRVSFLRRPIIGHCGPVCLDVSASPRQRTLPLVPKATAPLPIDAAERVVIVMAMEAEAAPLRSALGAATIAVPGWAAKLPVRLAAAAGPQWPDVILAVNGAPVNTPAEMIYRMSVAGMGAQADVTLSRGGAEQVVVVDLMAHD